jgi:hypothetical protein
MPKVDLDSLDPEEFAKSPVPWITSSQRGFIEQLLDRSGWDEEDAVEWINDEFGSECGALDHATVEQASWVIERLKEEVK